MGAKAVAGTIPDKDMAPIMGFFDQARQGIPPWRATTDELLESLTRAALGE